MASNGAQAQGLRLSECFLTKQGVKGTDLVHREPSYLVSEKAILNENHLAPGSSR